VSVDFQDVQQQLADTQSSLRASQQSELALRQERRKLQEEKETLDLTLNRRLDEERGKIRETAKKEAAEERQLKEADKDKLISDLTAQIRDLERKAQQGSQQTQGEVLELELEAVLQRHFPQDTIEPVPKGIHGGDILHHVNDLSGAVCGTMLWEFKRTKNWSDSWLPKLRDDQRAAKAQIAILVSVEMPKGISTFHLVDGIWVTSCPCAPGVAMALRAGLIELAAAKRSLVGRNDKMEILYNYLSGQEFRHRMEGIVEAFMTLRSDLEAEKRSMQRVWARREKQLERAVTQTAGMYGDLSGIIGASLPVIDQLTLPVLPEPDDDLPLEATQ
jgi:hypothetical protein